MSVKNVRARLAILREAGLTILDVTTGRTNHRKVLVRTPGGVEVTVIVAEGPSCPRADLNLRTFARRLAAADERSARRIR